MPKRKRPGSKSKSAGNPTREESLTVREVAADVREDAANAQEKQLLVREQTAADVRLELEGLMAALREANGHLIVANLRSQALAEQMNDLYEEAKTAIQAKDDFFTMISHELRTPLTSITGWAALLERDQDAATIAEAARSIASSAAVQAKLIDDLLDVSRIMTGKFAVTEAETDLRDVIDDSVSAMRPLAAAKGVSLRMTAVQSIIINGDAGRLRQVVANLLSNAIKFTPMGGLIETQLTREGSFAVIQVWDTGEGISSDFLPYVFDRRAQASPRRFAGLGLGLAIVKHIVELHGGSVTAASGGEGKGATFTVRIPCGA
ncbi:MAG: HAMP domain-containing histidine kinase [Acidobacteriota bacterium]|nr:HAMP domain-containing histidine kinase [Acidobacteriota bacterium]